MTPIALRKLREPLGGQGSAGGEKRPPGVGENKWGPPRDCSLRSSSRH